MSVHRYSILTAFATFLLLIAGSLVTSTDSGLAVPDWPLSYGTWFPPMVGGILYEHGHRMIAGVVALLILGLAVWLGRTEPRRWVRRLGFAALAGVVLQALLGGLTVLLLLPPQISIAHACLGQVVFCLIAALAWTTSPGWASTPPRVEAGHLLPVLSRAVAALAALQLVLGAVIRHTGSGVTPHLIGASALAASVIGLAWAAGRRRASLPTVWAAAIRLAALVLAQGALGAIVLAQRTLVPLRTAHVGVGALILAQAVLLAWDVARRTASASRRGSISWGRARDYLELTKPRLSLLVLITTGAGCWLGMRQADGWPLLLTVGTGTALVVGGANALNQWIERAPDALMRRTRHRPLPDGRLAPEAAHRFGLTLSLLGLLVLAIRVNLLSASLAALAWATYVLVYTPLKRVTPLCTLIGAIPGALPPVIGWAGARGSLDLHAAALFAILFVWQLPHFLALAVLYRDDYARAGFPMLPLTDPDGGMTARQTFLYGLALAPISLVPTMLGVAGAPYFYGAIALSAAFLCLAARAAWFRSVQSARQLFRASVLYLPALLGLLAINRIPL